jgi:hypothetical protein
MGMKVNVGKYSISCMGTSEEDMRFFTQLFPYQVVDLNKGIKYLGFYIKPNDYGVKDWD